MFYNLISDRNYKKMYKIGFFILFLGLVHIHLVAQIKPNSDSLLITKDVPIIHLNTDHRLVRFVKFNENQLEKFKAAKERAKGIIGGVKDARKHLRRNKRKTKKNEYYGSKIKKGFTKKVRGRTTIIEKFSYLPDFKEPPKLIRYKTYFLKNEQKIVTTDRKDLNDAVLLHGKYTKTEIRRTRNGKTTKLTLVEGFYYRGVKNERWLRYNRNYVLIDKRKYKKGIPAESKISYYDPKKTKLKEILPIHNGYYDGNYFLFYPSGRIKEQGTYQSGYKIGKWRIFYDSKVYRRRKDIQYPKKPFDEEAKPYIIREWDTEGKLLIDNRG